MRFYSIGDTAVLDMPVVRFWTLNKCIDRLASEEDYRKALIGASVQDGESLTKFLDRMREQMGTIVVMDQAEVARDMKIDREGLSLLKDMARTG
jgi:hypothetical protein